jgi:hypothetical protein
MLKLKHAVNSFVITKKKFNKNKRMRGGAEAAEPKVKPLFDALTEAIETEFKNCTEGIDDALRSKSAENTILLNKKRILIPILITDLKQVSEMMGQITDIALSGLKTNIKENIVEKLKVLEPKLIEIEGGGIDAELPESIKTIYTSVNISPLSRIKKILALFDIKGDTIVPVENIEEVVREEVRKANTEYQEFLDKVTAKSNSTGSNVGASTTGVGGMKFTATTHKNCTSKNCIVEVTQQVGGRKTRNKRRKGVRKSQNKKILKGGRRRR